MGTFSAMPARFSAGTTLNYQKSFPDYPSSAGWSFKLYLAGADASLFVVGNEIVPGVWEFDVDAVTTGAITAGIYRWVERATNGAQIVDLGSGLVTVVTDVAQAGAGELLSFEERELAKIEALIDGRITDGALESYQIAGRAASRWSMKELLEYRDQLKAKIRRMKNGGRLGRNHYVTFRPAS